MAKKKKHGTSRAERKRHGRNLGTILLGLVGLAIVFYFVDYSGPEESLAGLVVETRTYTHNSGDQQGSHTHIEAVVEFEGKRHSVRPGDRFRDGDRVRVLVRRGRLTRYPYFISAGRGPAGGSAPPG